MEAVADVSAKVINVPALRFSGFEGAWKRKEVGELCGFIVPGRNKPTKFEGDIPWITTPDLEHNRRAACSKTGLVISREEAKTIGSKVVPVNSIIISCVGELGLVAIAGRDLVINQQLHAFIPNSSIDYRFLMYALSIQKRYMERIATTTSVTYMNKDNCNSIPIVFPHLTEQKKIADFITTVDDKIQQLSRKKELLEKYKKGVMQQIFSRQIRFKDNNGNGFPVWEEKRLDDVAKEIKRKAKNDINFEKLEVLTITAGTGFISQKERFSQVIAGQSLERYTLLRDGEMSYNRGASKRFQFGCIYPLKSFGQALVPNIYISFAFANQCDSDFYSQLFSTGYANRQLRKFISSSARLDGLLNINKNNFFSLRIPVPSLAEQKKISDFLNSIDSKINFASKQLEQAQKFKRGLLQQMFV